MREARKFSQDKNNVYESHPELCFAALNNKIPLSNSKHSEEGVNDRLGLLTKIESDIEYNYNSFLEEFRKEKVTKDDVLDSLVLSFSATSILKDKKNKVIIPSEKKFDKDGLRLQICYSTFLTS